VHQQVVELVEVPPVRLVRVRDPPRAGIRVVEPATEAAEQLGHGQVDLSVGAVHGWIDDHRLSVQRDEGVPAPEISVHEGRAGHVGESVRRGGQDLVEDGLAAVAGGTRLVESGPEASIAPEAAPG
jgi:hypothetical protein